MLEARRTATILNPDCRCLHDLKRGQSVLGNHAYDTFSYGSSYDGAVVNAIEDARQYEATFNPRYLTAAAELGAVLMPPVPAFYSHPRTIDDIVDQTVGRALSRMGIANELYTRWSGLGRERSGVDDRAE